MKRLIEILLYPTKLIFLFLIYIYRYTISPLIPHKCCFSPTCSKYAIEAIKKHGVIDGTMLACKRIIKCNPKSKGGVDLVPLSLKGEDKWLF